MSKLVNLTMFRGYVNKVLPTVYDDSLSYYEVLAKVMEKINEIINLDNAQNEIINNIPEDVSEFAEDLAQFKSSMTQQFNDFKTEINADFDAFEAEVNAKVAADSTPTQGSTKLVTSGGVYASLQDIINSLVKDARPTEDSTNYVTSGGVWKAINDAVEALEATLATKQNALTWDTTPTANSTNPVQSGGIKTYVDNAAQSVQNNLDGYITTNNNRVSGIEGDITGLETGKQDALTFDLAPTLGSNNPVTSNGIAQAIAGVTPSIEVDPVPTQGSTNPVSSNGVYVAVSNLETDLEEGLADKQDTLTWDTTPTKNSQNPVTSGGLFEKFAQIDPYGTVDPEPEQGSPNAVSSGGTWAALQTLNNDLTAAINTKQDTLTFDAVPTEDSENPVYSGGVFDELELKADKTEVASIVINDSAASNITTFSSNKIIDLISGQPKDYEIYTFRIDHNNSDPSTAVRPFIHGYGCDNYDYQNAGMDYSNDVFKYGDWANAFFIRNLKPCYLNADGTIEYELNKDDYKKKKDGTTASEVTDLTSTGNVMVGFPTVWFYRYTSGDYEYVVVSNKQLDYRFKAWAHHDKNGNVLPYIYLAAYNGSLSDYDSAVGVSTGKLRSISGVDYHNLNAITNNKILSNTTRGEEINFAQRNNAAGEQGEGWYIRHKAEWDMVNDLLVLISGTTDTETAFGNGVISGYVDATNTGIKATGLYDDKGLFYGKSTQTDQVKVFGIEAWWGNIWNSLAGWIMVSGTQKVKMTHGTEDGSTVTGFNTDGSGYVAITDSTPSGTSGGYISSWSKSEYGMIPTVASGTSSTYLCDGLWYNNSDTRFAFVGGHSDGSWRGGAFCSYLNSWADHRSWGIGAALSYKPLSA